MKHNIQFRLGLVLALGATTASAQLLDLSKAPLFLNSAVDPNLMVTFDDSGSMGFGFTPDKVDDGGSTNCAWRYKRYYSAAFNKQYYNPAIVYAPPLYQDGSSYPDQTFSNASTNGFSTVAAKVNLGSAYFVTWWEGYSGTASVNRINHNNTATAVNCGQGDGSSKTYKFPTASASAFYCTLNIGAPNLTDDTSYTCQAPTATEQTNFANWFAYYRYRGNALKSSVARSFGTLGEDLRVAWQNMNANRIAAATDIGSFSGTRRKNFFDWLVASPLSGATPTLDSVVRAGNFFARSGSSALNPYWDATLGRELMCRQNFHVLVTDGYWNQSTHPSASTPGAGSILNSRTLPDGRAFAAGAGGDGEHSKFIWNEVPRGVACSGSRVCIPSYSDLAFHYWATDLRPTLDNKVPAFIPDRTTGVTGTAVDTTLATDLRDIPEVYWNPKNDPATWQHVVQFFIGFGVDGRLAYNDTNYTSLRTGPLQWPYPRNNDAAGVDDSWHGALASRGKYFGASDPNQVSEALSEILSSIVQRKGSNTAVAVSTGIIGLDTAAYQTQFDSTDWSGSVIARPITVNATTGRPEIGDPIWDAGCVLTGGDCATTSDTGLPTTDWDSGRQILTSRVASGSDGAPFRAGKLASEQLDALSDDPETAVVDNDGLGADRLEYLRGKRDLEASSGGTFRNRKSLFGAVVHSSAVVLAPPGVNTYNDSDGWEGGPEESATENWKDFVDRVKNEPRAVAVGANDGMLHVLDAATGAERFAYVPYATYPNLSKLTDPMYQFEPTVDGDIQIRPVFTHGAWRMLLVGSLRGGGQSLFALDVTRPSLANEGDASQIVQWEFSDQGDADLGYTYGQPFITRLRHDGGRWVVLVPASYNSQRVDAAVGTGRAVMLVLDAEDGSLIRKFDLTAIDPSARGLAGIQGTTLVHADINDYAYAGDLAGHVWRFDLRHPRPASWSVSKMYEPSVKYARPITAAPRAEYHPVTRQPMIFVGTGKYIEKSDRSTAIPTQAFYGLIDPMDGSTLKQADLHTWKVATSGSRRTTVGAPSLLPKSWQIEFDEATFPGERVVSRASLNIIGHRVIFTTLIPAGDDPCLPGGKSFVMFADFGTGGRASDNVAYFDTDNDGDIDETDNQNQTGVLSDMVPGVASILPPGGGIGAIVLPPAGGTGTPTTITTREFEWRRRAFRDRTELQGED